jgi:hypothetical protein
MKPWFKYLKLLKSALDKLPDVNKQIWQRIGRNEEHEKTLKKDQSQLYTCMSSCWPLYEDAKHDLNQTSVSKTIFVGYEFVNGKDVTDYTEGRTKEVMIWPGAKIYVMKVVDDEEDGSTKAYIKRLCKCYKLLSYRFFFIFESVAKRGRCLKFPSIILN